MNDATLHLQQGVPLSPYTTINLGGEARYFLSCESTLLLKRALTHARNHRLRVHILGGGSNTIFPDAGFDGLVLHIGLRGISVASEANDTLVTAAAGEEWDPFVRSCVLQKLAGLECLSGIPGLVGAAPMQNIGAYGQEICETLARLKAIDRQTLKECEFAGSECGFGYRQSRFKREDAGRFVITEVTFRLKRNGNPAIRYPELQKLLESRGNEPGLEDTRAAVLSLRKSKSMIIDPSDPETRSVGSFFTNPVLSESEFVSATERWGKARIPMPPATYPAGTGRKIPAAWLVEQSGFPRGYRRGSVGVSARHALALVNYGGSSNELLSLANDIGNAVFERFGLHLEREPVVVE